MYARWIAAAVLCVAALGAYKYVMNLKDAAANLRTENTELHTLLKTQNDAITRMKTQYEERMAAGKIEIAKARDVAVKQEARATVIYKTKPSVQGDDCQSAFALMNGDKK